MMKQESEIYADMACKIHELLTLNKEMRRSIKWRLLANIPTRQPGVIRNGYLATARS